MRRFQEARRRSGRYRASYNGPIVLAAAYSGTFWLKATPHLSNVWVAAVGSSYGDDPRDDVNAFFRKYKTRTGEAAQVDSYPLLGYSLVQTIAKGVEMAGTTEGKALAEALETFKDIRCSPGPPPTPRTATFPSAARC